MSRYRLLVYDGDPDWIENMKRHDAVKEGEPLNLGPGTIASYEVSGDLAMLLTAMNDKLKDNDPS